jgi:hypothetical protein
VPNVEVSYFSKWPSDPSLTIASRPASAPSCSKFGPFAMFNEQVATYRVENLPADEATRRKVFEFAKGLVGAPIIIVPADSASSTADLDKLATEYDINIAIDSKTDPKALAAALNGRSNHMGVAADIGAGSRTVSRRLRAQDRGKKLMAVDLGDRTGTGAGRRTSCLAAARCARGLSAGGPSRGLTPLVITVASAGTVKPT